MSNELQGEAWLASRIGFKTASRFDDVMAKPDTKAHQGYMLEVATERLTQTSQASSYTNQWMQNGSATEPFAQGAYEAATGTLIENCGLILHPTMAFTGASPDGLVGDVGLIECKCPKSTTHMENLLAKKLPTKYRPQVYGQLLCTGRQWVDFISFDPKFPPHAQLLIVRVERDEKYITELAERLEEFERGIAAMMQQIDPTKERQ